MSTRPPVTVKDGARAAQTILTKRNGRLSSQQNFVRVAGPFSRHRKPPPIQTVAHRSSTPDCSSPHERCYLSSPPPTGLFAEDPTSLNDEGVPSDAIDEPLSTAPGRRSLDDIHDPSGDNHYSLKRLKVSPFCARY
jgi:hypothetical protein